MKAGNFEVPILLIIFNKVLETQRIFSVIQNVRPTKLFLAADGPRKGNTLDIKNCIYIRNWIISNINWDCKVQTLIQNENLGCGYGPYTAISWFFKEVNEGIILEDDCLPCSSFFPFCEENLDKYRYNKDISIISGNNFHNNPIRTTGDYYFSAFPSTWGWASWRRTWDGFNLGIESWNRNSKSKFVKYIFKEKEFSNWWINKLDSLYKEQPEDMWDFQFHFHCMRKQQLAIIPRFNLVSNIGHGISGTHTLDPKSTLSNLETFELIQPLKHPERIERNYFADVAIQKLLFGELRKQTLRKIAIKKLIKPVLIICRFFQ